MHNNPGSYIYLVDDDEDDAFFLKLAFEKVLNGHKLKFFKNGKEAVNDLLLKDDSEYPLFILLDLNMPIMDGRETLNVLKKHPELNRVPIIMFTTSSSDKDIKSCYHLGANSYICKPSNAEEFDKIAGHLMSYWTEVCKS
jgi:CheY-like chemotaxis protein